MLKKSRTAILFTANTPHLAHANLMLDSLLDSKKGNFKGDIWVISTGLSERAKNYCDSRNINYYINPLNSLFDWNNWWKIAESQPEFNIFLKTKDRNTSLREAFEIYRNKRMSKLILLDWVNKFGDNYDYIALGDNDLYFQKDIHKLFEMAYEKNRNKIFYWQEENEITVGSWLWRKNFQYTKFYDTTNLDFGKHEINIGFILGRPDTLFKVFSNVKKYFFSLNIELFTRFFWHDQDLVRLDRATNPDRYELLPPGEIVHLCNGGENVILEKEPSEFYHIVTEKKPYIIHFAGGAWKKYLSIKDTYLVDPDSYYFSCERTSAYNTVKTRTRKELFSEVNPKYFTKQSLESRVNSRRRWIEKTKNGKTNILLMGWLAVPTHNKSICDVIPDFFENDYYNLACLAGNVTNQNFGDIICEEFPPIIASLTSITYDAQLISYFGIKFEEIPEWVISDGLVAAQIEYGCSEATARAIVNLIYIYASEAIDFYRPDLAMCICTTGLFGKVVKNLCKEKHIPLCDMEWGVLPGTISFDLEGHMAESWICSHSDHFNALPLCEDDLTKAKEYLSIADDPELSRNKPQKIRNDVYENLSVLKKSGKKLILYMESNSAGSGNTYVDERIAKVHSPYFKDDSEGYNAILKVCKNHENWHIIYKPHPISITRGLRTKIDEHNTTIIYEGSLQECLMLSDASVTLLSQSAYISLIYNVPVILLGNLQLNSSDAAYVYRSNIPLEDLLNSALNQGFTEKQKESFLKHVARVMKYYVYSANEKVKCRNSMEMAQDLFSILQGRQKDYLSFEQEAYEKQKTKDVIYNTSTPLVSVVMPVHNVEMYLPQSISSIINQTEKSLELICVENGSTDNSLEIIKYYQKKDPRIKLIVSSEVGLSNARNMGLLAATGKYIYFIDSDDYLDENALEILCQVSEENNIDLLYFFYKEVHPGVTTNMNRPRFYSYLRFFPKETLFQIDEKILPFLIQYPFAPLKFMNRCFLIENSLYFDTKCKISEDNVHNIQTLLTSKNPYVYNEQFYNYRRRKHSITTSSNENAATLPYVLKKMDEILKIKNCYYTLQKWYVPYKAYLASWGWTLIPNEKRDDYVTNCVNTFSVDDMYWIDADDVWPYFELPIMPFARRIKSILLQNSKGNSRDQNSIISTKVQSSDNTKSNDIMKLEPKSVSFASEKEEIIQPWEKINKVHLLAIKICEKLHIINLAIKVKGIIYGEKS